MALRGAVALLVLALSVSACSSEHEGDSTTVTGAVVAVTGDVVVESFVVRNSDGSSLQFTPAQEADFSPDKLRALVVSGDEVTVVYRRTDDKKLVAVSVDASG